MRAGFPIPEGAALGILVNRKGEPVVPTIVFCRSHQEYYLFCTECRVSSLFSPDLLFMSVNGSGTLTTRLTGHAKWRHVAFVGIHPMQSRDILVSASFRELDRYRKLGYLERAFHYPDGCEIIPNFTDEGREW